MYWAIKVTEENKEELLHWILSRPDVDLELVDDLQIDQFVCEYHDDRSYQIWNNTLKGENDYYEINLIEFRKLTQMNKQITLTLEQARKIYKKSPEMDELLLANFSKQELEKSTLPTSWTDFKSITGYYINSEYGCTIDHYSGSAGDDIYKDVFATEKQAKSALAMAQLSQLMRVYNGDWEPDWTDTLSNKYVIRAVENKLKPTWFSIVNQFLAFKTAELRDEFLENFEDLIKEYYMID